MINIFNEMKEIWTKWKKRKFQQGFGTYKRESNGYPSVSQ